MTEHIRYPIEPDVRPMGPLEEGDQAIVNAIESIPLGHHKAYEDGRQIVSVSRICQPGVREELTIRAGDVFDLEDRVLAHVVQRGISTEYAGVNVYGNHKVKYDSDRVSDGIVATNPTRSVSSREAQTHKLAVARAIMNLSQKMEAAGEVVDIKQARKNRKTRPLLSGQRAVASS